MFLVLASGSPRRKEILTEMGIDFCISATDVDESSDEKDPVLLTRMLARRKAEAAAAQNGTDNIILAADTVVYADGEILGKPRDEADARRMLHILSGSGHNVVTGICLIKGKTVLVGHDMSTVTFKKLSEAEINEYIATGEAYGKAGGYAIQGLAGRFVERTEGSISNVIGLSKEKLLEMLEEICDEK